MFDTMVLVTFFIALTGALVAGYLNGQRKDRCLRDFVGDHVSLVFGAKRKAAVDVVTGTQPNNSNGGPAHVTRQVRK